MPTTAAGSSRYVLRQPKSPVCCRISAKSVSRVVTAGTKSENLKSQFSSVSAVEDVKVVAVYLEAGLDRMLAACIDEHIVKLRHSSVEPLHHLIATDSV